MTTSQPGTPKVLGSTQLYTAATIFGLLLFPHIVLALRQHWPVQAFNLHCVLVLVLFGLALRGEHIERAAAAAAVVPRQRKKPHHKKTKDPAAALAWLDRSLED